MDGTKCDKFSSGTATTLDSVTYKVDNHGKTKDVKPPKFMYWVKVTAVAGNNTFVISQSITTGNFNTQFKLDGGGNVFKGSDCKPAMGVHMSAEHDQRHQQHGHRDVQRPASGRLLHCGEVPDRERWWRSRPCAQHNRSLRFFDHRRARLDQQR